MNTKKSHKFAPNSTNEWKSRGFKSSNTSTSTSAESYAVRNQEQGRFQNSVNFKRDTNDQPGEIKSVFNASKSRRQQVEYTDAKDDQDFNLPIWNKCVNSNSEQSNKPSEDFSITQTNANSSGKSLTSPKKKKKKNVTEGKLSEIAGEKREGEESSSFKRKKQKFQGYTLFIGNLSYDTTKDDVLRHFSKCGVIKNIRIPLEKTTNEPRGFGYIEVEEHVTYENVLSMHHTFLKRRRINVECTFGGSKTSQKRMALIKEKTLKLRFLSREGKISSAKQRPWGKFSRNTAIS